MAFDTENTQQALMNRAYDPQTNTLHASATETSNGQTSSIDIGPRDEAVFLLDITDGNADGDETLDIKIQTSDDDSDWYDLGDAFAQKTSTGKSVLKVTNFGKYVRASWTVGGTTPSFTFSLKAVAKTTGV